ncbi:MAG: cysteine methyltransferase, partial [Candidatus Limnocylindria bacterium]
MNDELERRLREPATGVTDLDIAHLRSRLARAAADAGLLDVAYSEHDSPLGPLTLFVTSRGILRISYPGEQVDDQTAEVAAVISPRVLHAPERTDTVRRQLDEYFAGSRRTFDLAVDWRLIRGFAG